MSDRDDELEERRGEYELGRLGRDAVSVPVWGTVGAMIGLALGGPVGAIIGGAAGAAGAGADSIKDKYRRDREWNGEE